MGTFGKSLSRELGKNTSKWISNKAFGDGEATPHKLIHAREQREKGLAEKRLETGINKNYKFNKMKNLNLTRFLIVSLVMFGLTGCQKDNTTTPTTTTPTPVVDSRDQYVGKWNFKKIGSVNWYLQDGSLSETTSLDRSGIFEAKKSGEKSLIIGGILFFINDKHLSADPISNDSRPAGGGSIIGTAIHKGTLGTNIIILNYSESGTWTNKNGVSGTYSGKSVTTLTK